MNRKELDFCIEQYHCKSGGTKEAAIKLVDFMRLYPDCLCEPSFVCDEEHQKSCVTQQEFKEAIKTLMAAAFQKEDFVPEKWRCDSDCRRVYDFICPGDASASGDETAKLCPFFTDEADI